MSRLLLGAVAAVIIILIGCSKTLWIIPPGGSEQQLLRDSSECRRPAQRRRPPLDSSIQAQTTRWLLRGSKGSAPRREIKHRKRGSSPPSPPGEVWNGMSQIALTPLRAFLQWRVGDSIMLGEPNVSAEAGLDYFGQDGDRIHMMFNFHVNQTLFYALAASDCRPLVRALKATNYRPEAAQWCLFLRNHDELDLGRLSEEQSRPVIVTRHSVPASCGRGQR